MVQRVHSYVSTLTFLSLDPSLPSISGTHWFAACSPFYSPSDLYLVVCFFFTTFLHFTLKMEIQDVLNLLVSDHLEPLLIGSRT